MKWIQYIDQSVRYMEANLENKICVEDVASHVYMSASHFQRMFNLVTGYTIGEYIRNRRLSQAGRDLQDSGMKVIDIALKYQYDTPESFTRAFHRFHGMNPSDVALHMDQLKYFYPLTIQLSIQGGFDMYQRKFNEFYWNSMEEQSGQKLSDQEKYQALINWAGNARGKNPNVFDSLTEWILDDSEWSQDQLSENEQIFMEGILGRFKKQNAQLRQCLKELEPSGIVNAAVFAKLDCFDQELDGACDDPEIKEAAKRMFTNFDVMLDHRTRELIAGSKTGPAGTNSVKLFGYVNHLKECDAQVQWTLFMPDEVTKHQLGFQVENFHYETLPAMRFIGFEGPGYEDSAKRLEKMKVLDSLKEYQSDFNFDLLLMHFYGAGVDSGQWHGIWGRFMKADTPVPQGYQMFDFLPEDTGIAGPPYISQFAYATFTGDPEAMHKREGFDGDAMYDTTRNIILGQGVTIPYPTKYWTAEVYPDGCDKNGTGYLFSVKL